MILQFKIYRLTKEDAGGTWMGDCPRIVDTEAVFSVADSIESQGVI
ncbi:MAG: hypothetical protein JNL11_02305 [Bdellovibrionaceae bacterium]|nr:hypothetical protein [Pseudobdellovibrionaceae bacterium]